MMKDQKVALVTGANQGIGFQIAKELSAKGFTVLIGSRNLEEGEAAAKRIGANAHAIELDVTKQQLIDKAAAHIRSEFGRLDVLVNNAGISRASWPAGLSPEKSGAPLEQIARSGLFDVVPLEDVRRIFETNVFGVIAVTQAMLPLLKDAPSGRIVNVASSGGSLALNSDPTNAHRNMFGAYSASKSAAHAVTFGFAMALQSTNIKVNAACPGFTKTALNNFQGTRTLEEGAREPVRLALLGDEGPTGTFSDEDGPVPW